jgi:hypothetical protein
MVRLAAVVLACSSACSTAGDSPGAPASAPPSDPPEAEAGTSGDASVDGSTSPTPKKSSGGSGGLACTRRDSIGSGRDVCVAKVGSVELKILEPKCTTTSTPFAVGLYVHGDGAGAHKSASAIKAMVGWADARCALAVSALAPNGCAWWLAPTHDCASAITTDVDKNAANTAALVEALEAIEGGWDVRSDGRYYYGSSGGSIFLTDQWLPLQGRERAGVFALMCGGQVPTRAFAWDTTDAAIRARDPLFFTYGDQDFLVPDIEASVSDAKTRGFAVTEKVIPGADHCAFDGHGEAVGIWTAN